jgi:hypothetical protein
MKTKDAMNLSTNFIGQCYSSDDFFWDKIGRLFKSDVSDTPAVLRQLYNDSMDLGFAMHSVKTGNIVYFSLATAQRDREGDMEFWSFEPTPNSVKANPGLADIKVIVFND